MAINSLTNAGEALVLKRSIGWEQAVNFPALPADPPEDDDFPTHDELEIRLYFKEYDATANGSTGGYIEPSPDGTTGWGAEVPVDDGASPTPNPTGYAPQAVFFTKPVGTQTIPDTRLGADPLTDTVTALLNRLEVSFPAAELDWRNPTSPSADATAEAANYRLVQYMAIWNVEDPSNEVMVWYGELKNSAGTAQGRQVDLDDQLKFAADKVIISMD